MLILELFGGYVQCPLSFLVVVYCFLVYNFVPCKLCRNSLLDEDVATDNFYGSSSFSPSSQYSMMSADNLTTEQFLESGQTTYGVGGSKCRKTHSFSPTTDWNQKFVTSPPIKVRISHFCFIFVFGV